MSVSRCSECGKSLARANAKRVASGLPRLPLNGKTCSPKCSRARQRRQAHERWAGIRHRRLVAERPVKEPWRCAECGIDAGNADMMRRRMGLLPIRPKNVVCGPKCAKARELRRYFVRYGRLPKKRRAKGE